MAKLLSDIHEQILVRLEVRDLIRCKGVCKSWNSLISSPRFIKAHLNHSYNNDRNNSEIGDRRIALGIKPVWVTLSGELDQSVFIFPFCVLGSSNGLVCISDSDYEILVSNPLTRMVKKLQKPQIDMKSSLCWGFGYDSSTDDYKVVLGFSRGENRTCFQVLTLKSNVWKVIGEVNYGCISSVGILCNGALHWFMDDASPQNKKKVILSFDLSKEEFKEIPQPDGLCFQYCYNYQLGILNDCLSINGCELLPHRIWIMKEYNVEQSWGTLGDDYEKIYEAIHTLGEPKHGICHEWSFSHEIWLDKNLEFINSPIFVQSLVSPHENGILKRKSQPMESERNDKSWIFRHKDCRSFITIYLCCSRLLLL